MDDLDQQLLLLLEKDSRCPASDLARQLGVSRGTVQNRIDRLVQQGTIERFTIELGRSDIDFQVSAFALIQLKVGDDKVVRAAFRRIPEIMAVSTLSGNFDLVVELRCSSLSRLDEVIDHIRSLGDVAGTQSHIRLRSWQNS